MTSIFLKIKEKIQRVAILATTALVAYSCSMSPTSKVTMENTTDVDRVDEIVEVNVAQLKDELGVVNSTKFVVYDSSRKEIPSQVTYDGKLIFQVSVAAQSSETYKIKVGEPKSYASKVFGAQFPDNDNDFVWENDKNAVRVFSAEKIAAGERLYGYEAWTKSVPELVVEGRYAKANDASVLAEATALESDGNVKEAARLRNSISLEVNHGNGSDAYNVGATLGAGCAALMERGSILYPQGYTDYEILDNGPLRLTVKFTYAPIKVGSKESVVETRIQSIDAGTCFVRSTISYSNVTKSTPLVVGIVMAGSKSKQAKVSKIEGYAAYADADRRDLDDGVIYVGTIIPEKVKSAGIMPFVDKDPERVKMGQTGHVVLISDYRPKSQFVYYWGSMWAKYEINSYEDWVTYVANRAIMVRNPLIITLK